MLTLPFGKTGHNSTRILFGAAAFYDVEQKDADRTMEEVIQSGVNHIDTAASYGKAELRLGPWIKHHRKKFFLATKTEKRSRKEALEELYRSLDLLHTDHIDLWQMHILIKQEEWDQTFAPDGALEAFVEAKEKGLVSHLGVTGHELVVPSMHWKSLDQYPFDSVLLPCNYALMNLPQYKKDFDRLYQRCMEKDIAFQCIKTLCRGPWGEKEQDYSTWYRPFTEQEDINILIGWILQKENVFVNSSADIRLFPKIVSAAEKYDKERDYSEAMKELAQKKEMTSLFL